MPSYPRITDYRFVKEDWPQPEFAGIKIYGDGSNVTHGHYIKVHELPNDGTKFNYVTQTMGRKPRSWSLGGDVLKRSEVEKLILMTDKAEVGDLITDMGFKYRVLIENLEINYDHSKRGVIGVNLTFLEAPQQLRGGQDAIVLPQSGPMLSAATRTAGQQGDFSPPWYREDLSIVAADWASIFSTFYASRMGTATLDSIDQMIVELLDTVEAVIPNNTVIFFLQYGQTWRHDRRRQLTVPQYRLSDKILSNRNIFQYLVQVLMLYAAEQRIVRNLESFTKRDDIESVVNAVYHLTDSMKQPPYFGTVASLVADVATGVQTRIRTIQNNLPSITRYEFSDGLNNPIYAAQRLYGDATLAADLMRRNRRTIGRLMPIDVEAIKIQ